MEEGDALVAEEKAIDQVIFFFVFVFVFWRSGDEILFDLHKYYYVELSGVETSAVIGHTRSVIANTKSEWVRVKEKF